MPRHLLALAIVVLGWLIVASVTTVGWANETEDQLLFANVPTQPVFTSALVQPEQPQTGSRQGLFKVGEAVPTRPDQDPATVRPVAFMWECPSPFLIWADNIDGSNGGLQTIEGTLTYQSGSMEITDVAPRQGFALDSSNVDPQQGTITFAASRSQGGVVDGPILEIQAQRTDGAGMGNVGPLGLQLDRLVDAGGTTFQPQQVVNGQTLVIQGGDVQPQDGQRDVRDALNTLKWSLDTGDVDLSERQRGRADVVPDRVINILDALNTLKSSVIEGFDLCQGTSNSAAVRHLTGASVERELAGNLNLDVSARKVQPGQGITLSLRADAETTLQALHGTVAFDPQLVQVQGIDMAPSELTHATVDREAGEIRFGLASLSGTEVGQKLMKIDARIAAADKLTQQRGTESLHPVKVNFHPSIAQTATGSSWVPPRQRVSLTVKPQASLQVDGIHSSTTSRGVTFHVQGRGIDAIRAQVFNLAGREVYATPGWVPNGHPWNRATQTGKPLANGVYLYRVTVRGVDGTVKQSNVRKLIVLR